MHEASLAGGILQLVERAQAADGFQRLQAVRLEVGALAGVEVRALRFALEALAPGTCLEGARIEIEEPPGVAWCLGCSTPVALPHRGAACPDCGSHRLQPTGGTELKVIDLLVDEDD